MIKHTDEILNNYYCELEKFDNFSHKLSVWKKYFYKEEYCSLMKKLSKLNIEVNIYNINKQSDTLFRILPFFRHEYKNIYIYTNKEYMRIGLNIIRENQSLTIETDINGKFYYTYCCMKEHGMPRITGKCKLTKNYKNSKYVEKILELLYNN